MGNAMLVGRDRRREGAQHTGAQAYRGDAFAPESEPTHPSALRRFLGGSPAGVFLRLLFLSVLAGAVMSMIGLTPGRLFWHAYESARALIEVAAASLHDFGGWVVAGAVVVVPLWLVGRLLAVSR